MKLTKYRQQNWRYAEFRFSSHIAISTCGYPDQEKSRQNSIKTLNFGRNHQFYFDDFLVKAMSIHEWKYILKDVMTQKIETSPLFVT